MKYIALLIMDGGDTADKLDASRYNRHLEFCIHGAGETEDAVLRTIQKMAPPRIFSSHVPYRFIEKQVIKDKVKIIVVMRNPKDALVSMFHFYQMNAAMGTFQGTWDEFFQLFKDRHLWGENFIDFSVAWWKLRHLENVFITSFEDMKRDTAKIIRQVADFLGKQLTDEAVARIVEETSFKKMKDNPKVNRQDLADAGMFDFNKSTFIRKGTVGNWKDYFTAEQEKYVNDLYREKCEPIGLKFHDTLWSERVLLVEILVVILLEELA